jgi:hypothetical protein
MIETRNTLSQPQGFTEQFVKVMSPVELGAEIRHARFKMKVLHSVPPGRIDLVA